MVNAQTAGMNYKGVGRRFLALVIDGIILFLVYYFFAKIFNITYVGGCNSSFKIGSVTTSIKGKVFHGLCGLSAFLYFVISFGYFIVLEWKFGGTLGKFATNIRVVKVDGENIDLKSSFIRNIMRIIDFLPVFYLLGAISVWVTKKKQRIGDILAKTVVVSK